ncbi:hypothetical protein FBEOM_4112 [Fusarium beomiforme]|uniref:Amidase domain-containing protein n=1 Tax=Fusarium beomiforme TaxID=44412 RepID=A0A9P5AND5_9HYPO|nr:hypothetical protein FBEOM_4112 [Fusarium beomiforme]
MKWQDIAKEAQNNVLQLIPDHWRLDVDQYKHLKDVTSVPYTCGLLTEAQLKITELTATEIVKQLRARQLKAVEVLEAFAGRTAITHQLINCLTEWFYDEGLEQAKQLDEAFEKDGRLGGALHGLPIGLKDIHSLKRHITTMAFVSGRNNVAEQDSAVVAALRAEGAIFFCKTTMPQSAMALETVSNLWGRTLNPFNRDLNAGGSSGGDAVLVAMKGTPLTPSTDLGGSIRVPAAFNGLYALKPTAARIPKGGMPDLGQSLIQVSFGPVCHSIQDMELLTKTLGMRFDIYYQGGADATIGALEASGEPLIPAFADLLKVFNVRKLSAAEILPLSGKVRDYKEQFLAAWNKASNNGRPMDALICPSAPGVGYPHDFNTYWGYTSLFNLIDYPAAILPVPGLKVSPESDPVNREYMPLSTNPYDKPNHEIYDPALYLNHPITIQVVGRPFEDEELIQVSYNLDALFRGA